jgi:hypothetical protein
LQSFIAAGTATLEEFSVDKVAILSNKFIPSLVVFQNDFCQKTILHDKNIFHNT